MSTQSTVVQAFRNGINQLARPLYAYRPIRTELGGMGNILSGIAQIVAGNIMKYKEGPTSRKQSAHHISRGTEAIKLGIKQFLPGMIAFAGAGYLYRNWSRLCR